MKIASTQNNLFLNFIFFFIGLLTLNAQSEAIVDAYEDFTEAPRELAYVHLNKSTYIDGEMMGFTAYVFDKYTKEPSKMTNNLYCAISDAQGNVIKEKLVRVQNGVASNIFDIDSTLSTGIYTFKAFTNWMRNFQEQNHFEQTFKVINTDNTEVVKPLNSKDFIIDLQALGEGGHIVYDISNTVGIIAKNQFGYGLANAYGSITDVNGGIVSEFKLNEVGLAKTVFTPIPDQSYNVNLNLNDRTVSQAIKDIKNYGLVMSLVTAKDKVSIMVKANKETTIRIKDKSFLIALHNGGEIITAPFSLNKEGVAVLSFLKQELYPGTNIFTIFDQANKPILERLYLNTDNIGKTELSKVNVEKAKDSLDISVSFSGLDPELLSNLSVSVLPSQTKSYNHHNNLLSQVYIQPYIKGSLQNGARYFLNNDKKTEYDSDLLMLTQGWSSYNWDTIFSQNDREYIYPFERGIDIVANVNNNKSGSYIVYPMTESNTQLFDLSAKQKEFTIKQSFPNEDDLFRIGYVNTIKKQFKEKPSLYLQYYPSQIPVFNGNSNVVQATYTVNEKSIRPNNTINAWDNKDINELDEVIINVEAKDDVYTKVEKLKTRAMVEKYSFIEENIKLRGMRVDTYLQQLGFYTYYDIFSGKLSITNPRASGKDPVPLVYLDNALLTTTGIDSDFGILTFITMDLVDYIEYEFYGIGGGIRGSAGYIKIFTTPGGPRRRKVPDNTVTYDLPLKFDKEKTFYTPKYQYYNTDFFNEYGTIGWEPKLSLNQNGIANLKVVDTETENITLFIEGIVNGDQYISQEIKIQRQN